MELESIQRNGTRVCCRGLGMVSIRPCITTVVERNPPWRLKGCRMECRQAAVARCLSWLGGTSVTLRQLRHPSCKVCTRQRIHPKCRAWLEEPCSMSAHVARCLRLLARSLLSQEGSFSRSLQPERHLAFDTQFTAAVFEDWSLRVCFKASHHLARQSINTLKRKRSSLA